MKESKIGTIEAISLVLTIVVNHIILNLPKSIISSTASAAPLNIIFIGIIAFFISYLVYRLLKNFPNLDILDISKFLGGKWLKNLIGVLFLLYFVCISSIILRTFCEALKIIYLQKVSISFIILLFIIAIIIINKLGFKSMIRANLLIMPIILFSIFFIFIANIKNFTFQHIFPILGYGIVPTFLSGISNLFAFGGIAYLYFLPPSIDSKNLKKISIISILTSVIFLFLSITSLLFMFPFIGNTESIMPLYMAVRYIEFSRFFQRLDAVFLLLWIMSIIGYLSIVVSFSIYIFQKITNVQDSKPLVYCFSGIIFIISLIPKDMVQVRFLENEVYKYLVLGLVFVISIILLILANIKYKRLHKKEGDVLIE